MKHVLTIAAIATAVSTATATPAAACSLIGDDTWGNFTFRDQRVPTNAELWITNVEDLLGPETRLTLIDPDGGTRDAQIAREGLHGRVTADNLTLTPGRWSLQLSALQDGNASVYEDVFFEVGNDVDTLAPAAPIVTVTSQTVGGNPLGWLVEPCGPSERRTIRSISIELPDATEFARVVVDGEVFNVSGTTVYVENRPEDGTDVVVSAFDFAGNESEPVVASPVSLDGCASVPAGPSALLALGLLLRRKRR